jgi:hypothetical protein
MSSPPRKVVTIVAVQCGVFAALIGNKSHPFFESLAGYFAVKVHDARRASSRLGEDRRRRHRTSD